MNSIRFRNFANYRTQALLNAGKPNWNPLTPQARPVLDRHPDPEIQPISRLRQILWEYLSCQVAPSITSASYVSRGDGDHRSMVLLTRGGPDEQHVGGIGQVCARGELPNQFFGRCLVVLQSRSLPVCQRGGKVRQFEAGFPSALFGGLYLDP